MVYKSWGKIAIATACYAAAPPFFAAGPVPYVNTCVCIPSLRQIAVHVGPTLRSMTTFLGVWHQSLGVTSKWLRGRRGVRGGDSRLHCAVLPVVPLAGGRGSGYVARPPRKRAKTRQKSLHSAGVLGGESLHRPQLGRNRASLRRSSEPLQASQPLQACACMHGKSSGDPVLLTYQRGAAARRVATSRSRDSPTIKPFRGSANLLS
jgi:hypothetical protein